MRLLLTSAGIRNPSIKEALLDLLGKPIAECNALCSAVLEDERSGKLRFWVRTA
jgi:dipeptidase E